jgi:hypothetical protein
LQTPEELTDYLKTINKKGEAVIFMSSGNWGGVDVEVELSYEK